MINEAPAGRKSLALSAEVMVLLSREALDGTTP